MSKQLNNQKTCTHEQFVEVKSHWSPAGRKQNGTIYICIFCGQLRIVKFNGNIEIKP